MDGARVVRVRSGSAEGSAYVLGGRLVLTAAHVLRDRERASIQIPGRAGWVPCRVVWGRLDEGPQGWDAALLLAEERLADRPLPAVRWGRLVTLRPCPAQAVGFPVVGRAGSATVTRVQRDGRVLPESGRERDRYVLAGDGGAEPLDGASPWSGMSGAALWCGSTPGTPPLLTGVVAGDAPGLGHTVLEAVPAYVLASDPRFRALVEEHTGRAPLLEPADLQHVGDRTTHPRPPRSPADLLRPEQAVVSFMGREELLEHLADWCGGTATDTAGPASGGGWAWETSPVGARLLTGAGGAGKTRLAAELSARMTGRGWTAIRLTTDTGTPLDTLTQVRRPLLVVVDYAETRVPQLHALLDAVDHDRADTPVRVLALARAAGDWWTRAAEHPHGQALAAATVTAVPALHHTPEDRADAYRRAVGDFAARLDRTAPGAAWTALVPALTDPAALPPLLGADFDTPLSVQTAALLALLDATGTARPAPQRADTLEGRLLGHERKYWDETAASPERGLTGERTGGETRALAVALACLTPATDRDEARALLARLPGLSDDGAAAVRGALATWLGDLYPAPDGSLWGSLQPDRIAEHHLGAQVLREPALFTRVLVALPARHVIRALTVLTRTAHHPPYADAVGAVLRGAVTAAPDRLGPAAVTTATRSTYAVPLIAALTHLIDTTDDVDLMYRLSDRLPDSTLALGEWAAALTTALVAHHDTRTPDLPALARVLNNQSNRLAELGRREEALAAIGRAVAIRETLAERDPEAFLPELAHSLSNRSIRLAELGLRQEALAVATRAVDTYQALAARRPDPFLPFLATALNNQSNRLAELGRREEALTAITRAVEIREGLAVQRPEVFLPLLARALSNQSNHLARMERQEEAMVSIVRAVGIYQVLVEEQPDVFLPGLAGALNNHSNRLAAMERHEEALTVVVRVVEIREALAAQWPGAFLPALAGALNNHCNRLAALGRYEEALAAVTRALDSYQVLAERQPDAFLPELADAFNNRSNCLAGLGRHEEALAPITRAVLLWEGLAERHPHAFRPSLAGSLRNQTVCLATLGRREDALAAAARAVEISEAVAAQWPHLFADDLRNAVRLRDVLLGKAGE